MNVKIARTHLWKYKVIIKLYIEAKLIKTVVWVQIDKEISGTGSPETGTLPTRKSGKAENFLQ